MHVLNDSSYHYHHSLFERIEVSFLSCFLIIN